MIEPSQTSEWEEAVGGLALARTRPLTTDERERLERALRASRRVAVAAGIWTAIYVAVALAFVTHVQELSELGLFVCGGVVPTIAAVGYGQSAAGRARWLRADLASGDVRVFEGESLSAEGDPAIAHLAKQPRFAPRPNTTLSVELLSSNLPLPADGEAFAPHRARPLRVAVPASIAAAGATRALSTAEREEIRMHAARRRRIELELGVGIVWSGFALVALGRWAAHGFLRDEVSMVPGVRILVVSALGVAAIVSLWLRRREARALDASAAAGEVVGAAGAEHLPHGVVWTERGRPARWRRG